MTVLYEPHRFHDKRIITPTITMDHPPARELIPVHIGSNRREYLCVRVSGNPLRGLTAERYPRQGSDVPSSVAWAEGLVERPENAHVHAGDTLRYLPFSERAL